MTDLDAFLDALDKRLCMASQMQFPVTWERIATAFEDAARDVSEPAAAPELPKWARGPDRTGDYRVEMPDGPIHWYSPEYIERIGELRDILAARRRAGT